MLKQKYNIQDKFFIYDINDGTDGSIPFVLNSSRQKVDLLHNLDRDGFHLLAEETVDLDVLHSHAKGWKTYTLSYYDIRLKELVCLASMETLTEDKDCCKLFFTNINKMLEEKICGDQNIESSSYVFNPYHLKDDEHGENKIGMQDVFAEAFVNELTSSCEFHLDHSVKNHKKYLNKESRECYEELCTSFKTSNTAQMFDTNRKLLESLIVWADQKQSFVFILLFRFCEVK